MDELRKIAVLGLGYVGLPLSIEFSKYFSVVGMDTNTDRVLELKKGEDRNRIFDSQALKSTKLEFTDSVVKIASCRIYIVSVPTYVDKNNIPNMNLLLEATDCVASVLKRGDVVIYESTVYPGFTDDVAAPRLAQKSGLLVNVDFVYGYSPERISPGDAEKTINKVVKVTSGSTAAAAEKIDQLYKTVVEAGTYKANSIKVAEASKIVENAQRDINVAFVNELAIIFKSLNIDTREVLETAMSKWNFAPFFPGLVGGHCLGLASSYLLHVDKDRSAEYSILNSARKINDGMGLYIASRIQTLMHEKIGFLNTGKILVLGLAYKENSHDIRNTKVIDIIRKMKDLGNQVDIWDPHVNSVDAKNELDLVMLESDPAGNMAFYDVVVLAVAHTIFLELKFDKLDYPKTVFYDIKSAFEKGKTKERL